ncbi:MAG: phospholipase D family protein [Acetobacteraceae bacterium]|nr:phospholipase D family protein [Acetobacteraceae bacterium]
MSEAGARIGETAQLAEARVRLLPDNAEAFAIRALSAREATERLDLLYYAWLGDATGRRLASEVLEAAERGVRVRLLLDDLHVLEAEFGLGRLDAHPNVEVRLYNPFPLRRLGSAGALLTMLVAKRRLNHRMHNKCWIMDGRLVIAGGRNIGDEYFGAASQFNFRDLDLVIEGEEPARAATAIFEAYWSSARAQPLGAVFQPPLAPPPALDGAPEVTGRLADRLADGAALRVAPERVRIIADPPRKRLGRRRANDVLSGLRRLIGAAEREVLLVSPYFVPGGRGSRLLAGLARSGVTVRVVTNSLAATDVLAVHGGYARYRRRLLRAGVALHELKRGGQEGSSIFGSSGEASLHTKALCVDGRLAFVGSFNFDPRSAHLNTEMGVLVEDQRLAAQLREEVERLADPAHSWRVRLDGLVLRWDDRAPDGRTRVWEDEPEARLGRRLLARLVGYLPIEPHL